ncbi:MAG: hypothetical protein ACRELA_00155 [Candidatus Rokuibacteriota bacterium]
MFRALTAAVDGALAGWTMGERITDRDVMKAFGVAAGLLLPVLLQRRKLRLAAVAGLALAGYVVHELLKQDKHRILTPSIEASEVAFGPGVDVSVN